MTRLSYSAITSKHLVPSINKNAPKAPECPGMECSVSVTLNISRSKSGNGIFEREYIENRITKEIESFSITDHHSDLQYASAHFRKALEVLYEGSKCWGTGSFPAGLEIHTSDLDFTVRIPSLGNGPTFHRLMEMRKVFRGIREFRKVFVQKGFVNVLQMVHVATGVSIDISIDNDSSKRNTQLLRWYTQMDSRFALLCKAMKLWASETGVEGASKGKLNSFSLCLMMIHYLQVEVKPAVLPNIHELIPELKDGFQVEDDRYEERNMKELIMERGGFGFNENKDSLASLYLGFMKYYGDFDFSNNWISVKSGKLMSKVRKDGKLTEGLPENSNYITVEDPFFSRNCGGTVRHESVMKRIQEEFREEYERILKEKTIFGLTECNWSRSLKENGEKKDLEIQRIDEEKKKNMEEAPWGTMNNWEETRPHPRIYWNQENKKTKKTQKKRREWPKEVSSNGYEALDSLLMY